MTAQVSYDVPSVHSTIGNNLCSKISKLHMFWYIFTLQCIAIKSNCCTIPKLVQIERVIEKIRGLLSCIHHWGWYVGVKMRAWNFASAYMMRNYPILKFAKKIRTSQEPAYRCIIRFGKLGASFEGP